MSESVCTGRFRERSVLWTPGSALPDPPLAKAKACKMVRNHISCRCRGASLWLVVPWLAIIEQSSQEHSLCKCVISRKKSIYVINTDRFWRFTATSDLQILSQDDVLGWPRVRELKEGQRALLASAEKITVSAGTPQTPVAKTGAPAKPATPKQTPPSLGPPLVCQDSFVAARRPNLAALHAYLCTVCRPYSAQEHDHIDNYQHGNGRTAILLTWSLHNAHVFCHPITRCCQPSCSQSANEEDYACLCPAAEVSKAHRFAYHTPAAEGGLWSRPLHQRIPRLSGQRTGVQHSGGLHPRAAPALHGELDASLAVLV